MIISASKAREKLLPLIEQVNLDHITVTITSNNGNAVLVSESEWESVTETAFLLRTAANSKRFEKSLGELEAGKGMTVRYKRGRVLNQIQALTSDKPGTLRK
jgi:antitoxin YefM